MGRMYGFFDSTVRRLYGWGKSCLVQFWTTTEISDKLNVVTSIATVVMLGLVYAQLGENTKTNKVAIREQLYQSEAGLAAFEAGDEIESLATIWAMVPPTTTGYEFGAALLGLVTEDPTALKAATAEDLYHSMFDAAVFADADRRKETHELRRLFLHAQTSFYQVHNAFDYQRDGIITAGEWTTWKNVIREMRAHPMLLAVIWNGHENRYYSRDFAAFLQEELCDNSIPDDVDPAAYKRGKDFIGIFYSDMLNKDWPNTLPDY